MTTTRRTPGTARLIICAGLAFAATVAIAWPDDTPEGGRVFYVDFDHGSDENPGTSPDAPFRRAPGDPEAADAAAAVELGPGDTVRLKGGVVYFGRIHVTGSGAPDRPIVIDGNTDGTFGEGPAIVDGSSRVEGWERCASADEAGGNPNWANIFHAEISGPVDWQNVNLTSADGRFPVAQDPKPSDPFFQNRTGDFHRVDRPMRSSFPGRLFFEEGSRGNPQTPLSGLLGGRPVVVEPIAGGAVSVEFEAPVTVAAVGIQSMAQVHVRDFAVLGDGRELARGTLAPDAQGMERIELPGPVTVRTLTYRLLTTQDGVTQGWTRLRGLGAFTPEGENLLAGEIFTIIEDPEVLTATDPRAYNGMTVGFHGGNNFVHYRQVERFDPATHRIHVGFFGERTYAETRYAFFNSVRLIGRPGEFSVEPTGRRNVWRVHLWPEGLEDGKPAGVGYATQNAGIELRNASHVVVRGVNVRRQGGRNASGIMVRGGTGARIEDCEVAWVGGIGIQSLGAEGLTVAACRVHHNRGRGIFHRNGRDVSTLDSNLRRNGSTGLGHYNIRGGVCGGNRLYGHRGTHANGLTFYLGCRDMVIERNEVWGGSNSLTIQEAENIVIRNNIFDGNGRTAAIGIWVATPFRNVQFLNNTIVNGPRNSTWAAGVFSNNRGPEGLVFRNNIIDGLAGNLPSTRDHNLYTSWGPNQQERLPPGEGDIFEADMESVFVDPANRDFRLRPGSPAIGAGTPLDDVPDDFRGHARPAGRPMDLGAHAFTED